MTDDERKLYQQFHQHILRFGLHSAMLAVARAVNAVPANTPVVGIMHGSSFKAAKRECPECSGLVENCPKCNGLGFTYIPVAPELAEGDVIVSDRPPGM